MKRLGYYNGRVGPLEEMQVPMCDRGCYFGDGIYEVALSDNGVIFLLDEHVDRFFDSAGLLRIELRQTKRQLKDLLLSLLPELDDTELLVYWQATRETAIRYQGFSYGEPNLWVMIHPNSLYDTNVPYKAILHEDLRHYICNIKTINLAVNVIAFEKARQAGCQEAIFHRNGRVTECTRSNVSIIKNGVFRTAPVDNFILPGISRARLIKYCHDYKIPVDETPFTTQDLFQADEVIISSTAAFCVPVSHIDGEQVGGKAPDLLNTLRDASIREYKNSISPVSAKAR